ncbi:GGDEF domain-containing protein [Rhizobium sp. WYJ-E13]|uniref:GGDEF domain-containing protein n=1 Tax=Rhizobium sp. WYJ-E13 TaxID=2849093 RepID=UPI001C1F194B|nr:GGDEF domain-containing protein [Rhizobium sp. WYJ-E13]QWW72405.1 GGDEF domain-containing protein [Rhizobium sp. WYJ-E13]
MRRIVEKSMLTGLLSVFASLALSFIIVPLLGGQLAGAGLFMTIFCPLVISIPASALHFTQSEKIRRAEAVTKEALNKLADAYDALRVQSRTDSLTGILNRSAFMEELGAVSQRGMSGALLFLDLDYFKSINDRYGHATGDEALRCTGRFLARYQSQSDFAGRLGGEEFGLFQSNLTAAEMLVRCEEIREGVARIDLRSPSGSKVPMSASIGVLHCQPGFHPHSCLKAADENLYRAKASGRNMVIG